MRQANELTVLVPGLMGPLDPRIDRIRWLQLASRDLNLDCLEQLLAHCEPFGVDAIARPIEEIIGRAMGLRASDLDDWPVGRFCYQYDSGVAVKSNILRADPVYVRPGLAEVHLSTGAEIGINRAQSEALVAELNLHFEGRHPPLEAPHPLRWYVRNDKHTSIRCVPPSMAAAGLVEDLFPVGVGARAWRQWLNEVQMVLHASEVNEQRALAGQLPVNSLWLWGAGEAMPERSTWSGVTGDEALAAALGLAAGIEAVSLPDDAAQWRADGEHLLVLSSLYMPALRQDVERWRECIQSLETHWFKTILVGIESGHYDRVTIDTGTGSARAIKKSRWPQLRKRRASLPSMVCSNA